MFNHCIYEKYYFWQLCKLPILGKNKKTQTYCKFFVRYNLQLQHLYRFIKHSLWNENAFLSLLSLTPLHSVSPDIKFLSPVQLYFKEWCFLFLLGKHQVLHFWYVLPICKHNPDEQMKSMHFKHDSLQFFTFYLVCLIFNTDFQFLTSQCPFCNV